MNQEIKKAWLKALRSGDYEQGTRMLRSAKNKFCCLGVLTNLYAKAHNKRWRLNKAGNLFILEKEYSLLSKSVMAWAGLKNANPYCNESALSVWNDGSLYSFKKIANLIEKYL